MVFVESLSGGATLKSRDTGTPSTARFEALIDSGCVDTLF
jgi:hypothetical protein